MPAYNAGRFITETIQSVLSQSLTGWELIIVNDGSTDSTESILSAFKDDRIIAINSTNKGATAARNLAYSNSSGKYIFFLDADDLISPDFLANQLKAIDGVQNAVAISAWGRFYNNNLTTFCPVPFVHHINNFKDWIAIYWHSANPMTNPGRVLIPRNLIELAGPWNEELSLNDDLEYFTRIFLAAETLVINTNSVLYYRSGIEGLSGKKGLNAYKSLYRSLELSTAYVTKAYHDDVTILKGCANMWQIMLYEIYPDFKELQIAIQQKIDDLGGSDLPFPSGGYTKILSGLIGWKATKRAKKLLTRH